MPEGRGHGLPRRRGWRRLRAGGPAALAAVLPAGLILTGGAPQPASSQSASDLLHRPAPVRQSELTFETAGPPRPVSLRDASRDDRWLGLGVRDARWAPDGSVLYFRWRSDPEPGQDPEADPWYAVDREGEAVTEVPPEEGHRIPGAEVRWSRDGRYAVWVRDGSLRLYDARAAGPGSIRTLMAGGEEPPRDPRFRPDGSGIDFVVGQDLQHYDLAGGAVRRLTRRHVREPEPRPVARWQDGEQERLFEHLRDERARRRAEARRERAEPDALQAIPVDEGEEIEDVRRSPDGRWLTFRVRTPAEARRDTRYMDYVTGSGYAEARPARPKVGEPQDRIRLGVVPWDPGVDPDSVDVTWIELDDAGDRRVIPHGPEWSPEGDRALVSVISEDHKDRWIAELDPATGGTRVLAHDRDEAWLGGPPVQPNYFEPGLVEWLPGGRLVFASERTGWSHLYLVEADGRVRPLTSGEWEVRDAVLSRDRGTWLIQASREHPADDHLYTMPAAGGEMVRLTAAPGRHEGAWSPDGRRIAVTHSDNAQLPDLFLRDPEPGASAHRVTVSGTDAFYRHPLTTPEIVSFPHPDGGPVWAALYRPAEPRPERAAVIHVHGGGYRQFAHRGWSVYGWDLHLGFLHRLLAEGYTVVDFDYRGSAGFGRDYRTDIYRSMGRKDVDGAVAAVGWLVREHGIDPGRVGIYGVSYGGFMTLMSLFRSPGTFAAGIARAAVSDWSDYNHPWTRRILSLPYEDPDAYRRSSPLYHAEGLADPLLITHGLVDDNVHFQDAAQIIQRLIELEKEFEVMVYPLEPHTIQTEASRYDYVRRASAFFERHLLAPRKRQR